MTPEERIDNALNGWIQDAVICGKGQADAMDLRNNLVAMIKRVEAEEREACAKIADAYLVDWGTAYMEVMVDGKEIGERIRARGT